MTQVYSTEKKKKKPEKSVGNPNANVERTLCSRSGSTVRGCLQLSFSVGAYVVTYEIVHV